MDGLTNSNYTFCVSYTIQIEYQKENNLMSLILIYYINFNMCINEI